MQTARQWAEMLCVAWGLDAASAAHRVVELEARPPNTLNDPQHHTQVESNKGSALIATELASADGLSVWWLSGGMRMRAQQVQRCLDRVASLGDCYAILCWEQKPAELQLAANKLGYAQPLHGVFDTHLLRDRRKLRALAKSCSTPEQVLLQVEQSCARTPINRDFLKDFRWARKLMNRAWTQLSLDAASSEVPRMPTLTDENDGEKPDLPLQETQREASIRQELSMLTLSRLLFLCFVQSRGWLDGRSQFLRERIACSLAGAENLYSSLLCPLFFGVLNTPAQLRSELTLAWGRLPFLNGGLFAQSSIERKHPQRQLPNEVILAVMERLFFAYEFSADEELEHDSERSGTDQASRSARRQLDPVILGRVFESLMEEAQRANSGSFYTPRHVVSRMLNDALCAWLTDKVASEGSTTASGQSVAAAIRSLFDDADASKLSPELAARLDEQLASVRILDPAAGSGAFVLGAFERLVELRRRLAERAGQPQPMQQLRRHVATSNLYGVDLLPEAIRLCELRLWLALSTSDEIDSIEDIEPLPNLDLSLRQGDALVEDTDAIGHLLVAQDTPAIRQAHQQMTASTQRLAALKRRYVQAAGSPKARLSKDIAQQQASYFEHRTSFALLRVEQRLDALHRLERSPTLLGEARGLQKAELELRARLEQQRANTLARADALEQRGQLPDFDFALHFPEVMSKGGFDLIVGNPPWVRPHRLAAHTKRSMREHFRVCHRSAWRVGASLGGALPAAQVDLAAVFAERALQLLCAGGVSALLLPSKLLTSMSAGGFRREMLDLAEPIAVVDWSHARDRLFGASTYPAFVLSRRSPLDRRLQRSTRIAAPGPSSVRVEQHQRDGSVQRFHLLASKLSLSPGDSASPWLLLPPDAEGRRPSFSANHLLLGRRFDLRRGVVTGCNEVFVPSVVLPDGDEALLRFANGDEARVELGILSPLLRGCDVAPFCARSQRSLLLTHERSGKPLTALPAGVASYLGQRAEVLTRRVDLRANMPPWSIFRVCPEVFGPKVVWRDIAKKLEAAFLPTQLHAKPEIPLNSLYYCSVRDENEGYLLSAYLNSRFARQRCAALAEAAQGGHFRFFSWVVGLLPWPFDDAPLRTREALVQASRRLHHNHLTEQMRSQLLSELDELVMQSLSTLHHSDMGCLSARRRSA